MPDLPTLTLSQGHFDRVVAAFPGTTPAQKTESYRAWLIGELIDFVRTIEGRDLDEQFSRDRAAAMGALEASLPPRPPFPPTFG